MMRATLRGTALVQSTVEAQAVECGQSRRGTRPGHQAMARHLAATLDTEEVLLRSTIDSFFSFYIGSRLCTPFFKSRRPRFELK